jgi:hypothetical protein
MKPLHLIAFILFAFVLAETIVSNTALQITHLTVRNKKCPNAFNEFRIVQLSDLHSREFGNGNTRLLNAVQEQFPDMIVMTGDMVDRLDKDFSVFFGSRALWPKFIPYITSRATMKKEKTLKVNIISKHVLRSLAFGSLKMSI